MPRTGSRRPHTGAATSTRQQLVDAAVTVLAERGYTAATSRAVAEQAGCNQALVFYHHGSLNDLLLAALDASNQAALDRYRSRLEDATRVADLSAALRELYPTDRTSGHVALLTQMIAGGIVDPDLGAEVARRVEPWIELTADALARALPTAIASRIPTQHLAYVIVAAALGAELLAILTGNHERNQEILDRLEASSGIVAAFRSHVDV